MLGMEMMLKNMGFDPATVKEQIAQFSQFVVNLDVRTNQILDNQNEIIGNQKLIMEKLGIEILTTQKDD